MAVFTPDMSEVLPHDCKSVAVVNWLKKRDATEVEVSSGRLRRGAALQVILGLCDIKESSDAFTELHGALNVKSTSALATTAYSILSDAISRWSRAFGERAKAGAKSISSRVAYFLTVLRGDPLFGINGGYNWERPTAAPAELDLAPDDRMTAVVGRLSHLVNTTKLTAAVLLEIARCLYLADHFLGVAGDHALIASTINVTLGALDEHGHLGAARGSYTKDRLLAAVDRAVKATRAADKTGDEDVRDGDKFHFRNPSRRRPSARATSCPRTKPWSRAAPTRSGRSSRPSASRTPGSRPLPRR